LDRCRFFYLSIRIFLCYDLRLYLSLGLFYLRFFLSDDLGFFDDRRIYNIT
jgi:hypothetical protein